MNENQEKQQLLCQVCSKLKNIEYYNKLTFYLNDQIIKQKIIKEACKDCCDLTQNVKILNSKNLTYELINIPALTEKRKTNELNILNLNEKDISTREQVIDALNKNNLYNVVTKDNTTARRIIKQYENRNLLNPIFLTRIGIGVGSQKQVYYRNNEIENLVYLLKRGDFINSSCIQIYGNEQKMSDLIKKKWVYPPKDGSTYWIYVDLENKIKPCVSCLNVLSFEKFRQDASSQKLKGSVSYSCIDCGQRFNNERYRNWNEEKKKDYLQKIKQWKIDNKDKVIKMRNKVENKIKRNIRVRLKVIIEKIKQNKINDIIINESTGCTTEELKQHFESLFKPGMSWNNYGGGDYTKQHWHIDHIIPVSKCIDWDAPIDEIKRQLRQININHYTNLQPLWWQENIKKGNR